MAKQFSPNAIRSFDENWETDSRNNLPYSGRHIQSFLASQVGQAVGAAWFNQATFTLYFFRNADDRDIFVQDNSRTDLVVSSTVLNFSSDMYRVAVANNLPSYDIQAATNQPKVILSLGFDVQTKTISDTSWSSTGDGANVKAYIDAGSTGAYTLIPGSAQLLTAGSTYELDVKELLSVGANRVKIVFTSESDENVSTSVIYSIQLSEMYIEEFSNNWFNAIVEGDPTNYKLGGFRIVGSLSKTLHIEIYQGSSRLLHFEKLIGMASYSDTPYNFTDTEGLDLSEIPTGVFICKAYLTSGNLTSIPVSYNFMHVAAADKMTAQLVCVNNVAPTVYNYSTAALCNYAIYNAGFSTGTPHIIVQLWSGTTPTTKVDADYAGTTTGVIHTLEYTIEWLIEETINLYAYFNITMGSSSQVQSIPIDNSSVYPAESGADFYLNATTRSNNDTNRESIINEATTPTSEITATWERMSWVDGIDGWTTDPDGRKALVIPAGSKCIIPYRVMQGENMTFELCFRSSNVSDYQENIVTISENPTEAGFQGIRIRPTNITVHSAADLDASNDTIRGKSFEDETTNHLLLTIQNSFGGNTGKNLVTLYMNGCKALQYSYANGTAWENNGNIVLGSSSADLYVYSCRVYRKVLGVKAAEQNYINSLRTLAERESVHAFFNSVLNESTHEMLYEKVVNSSKNYNFFVVEMKDGATVPSRANGWAKDTKGYSDLEMHFGAHPEWDFKLFGVETTGQGTTSMDYYRWNLRWRIDKTNSSKKIPIAYYNSPTTGLDGKKIYNIQPAAEAKTVFFDGGANSSAQQHPAVMRITAKINMASSMQSHKIGATAAYTDLHDAIGLRNEAQIFAEEHNLPLPTVAVYQYPAFGFARKVSAMGVESYEFIGLFTIGPDKGDKPTFGYNIDDSIKENLITLEGTDHSRRMAKFQYPWNNEVEFRAQNECLNIVIGNNNFDNGWEVSNCHGLSTDEASDQASIQAVLESEFKPAYKVAWDNSTLIFPVSLDIDTWGGSDPESVLANINANAEVFRAQSYNGRFGYADMEFWIEGEYILYHYDIVTGQYVPGINLVTQNGNPVGTSLDEQNEWFKTQRRARFLTDAPNYWDIQDSAFHLAYCLATGATDNFAKNSYPYKMKTLANGGRFKWRQDDLDTIFDTDNRGSDSKPYYIEFTDAESGSVVFAGSTSVFWNLLYEVFWNDYGTSKGIESIGRDTVAAMASLGGGANTYSGIINFFKKYFWDKAQNYFPASAYNIDAAWKYETAWLANGQAVDPLSQSLGRHLEAEHLWCARRAIYIMSLFKVGAFAQYSDTSLGQITFRPQSLASITVTPMMWIYPALANGAGSPEATRRTQEGQPYTFVGPFGTDGQTTFYIQASNYLRSVGDWKDLRLAAQYVDNIDIVGAKLRTFKIGDETEAVTTNVPSLSFNNTKCLEEIDARNAASLTGPIDLSVCTRLRRAYLEGTNITQVTLPNGSKITTLHLSEATNTIQLKNLKFLTDLVMPSDMAGIRTLQVENCVNQDAFDMLSECFNSDDAILQYIRLIWNDIAPATTDDVHMLSNIAQGLKKDDETEINYRGINAQGNIEGNPVIEGTMQMTSGIYTDELDTLGVTRTEDYGEGLKRALCSVFGTLYVIYDPAKVYIRFADDEVLRVLLANGIGDGQGITMSDAAGVTDNQFPVTLFRGNTVITSFDEFKYFTSLTQVRGNNSQSAPGAFGNCSNLKRISLGPNIQALGHYAFYNCASLEELTLLRPLEVKYIASFGLCGSLTKINVPSLNVWLQCTFLNHNPFVASGNGHIYINGSEVTNIIIPNTITSINVHAFYNCKGVTSVTIPSSVTSVGQLAFYGCSALTTVTGMDGVTSVGNAAFRDCTSLASDINLPSLTGTLQQLAFANTAIKRVLSLGSITTISSTNGSGPFLDCASLEEVALPSTLTSVQINAFQRCTAIKKINITDIAAYCGISFAASSNPFHYSTAETRGLYLNGTLIENLVIPTGVTAIHDYAFYKNNTITSVTIPSSVTSIGISSFWNCGGLTSVTIPSSVTSIGSYAFQGCSGLTSVVGMGGVTSIAPQAFYQCESLEEIELPSSLTSIGYFALQQCPLSGTVTVPSGVTYYDRVFAYNQKLEKLIFEGEITFFNGGANDCPSLKTVVFRGTTAPTGGSRSNSFDRVGTGFKIYVPYSSDHSVLEAYKTAFSRYSNVIYELNPDGSIPTA